MKAAERAIRAAYAAKKRAYDQLQKATAETLPLGTVVAVVLGRAGIEAEIVRHDFDGYVTAINLQTMKRRRFHAAYKLGCGELSILARGLGHSIYADEGND